MNHGRVVNARSAYQSGGHIVNVDFDRFEYVQNGWPHVGSGLISWGDPRKVPDGASTASLLALALVALAGWRRWMPRR